MLLAQAAASPGGTDVISIITGLGLPVAISILLWLKLERWEKARDKREADMVGRIQALEQKIETELTGRLDAADSCIDRNTAASQRQCESSDEVSKCLRAVMAKLRRTPTIPLPPEQV